MRKLLGEMLVEDNVITQEQLEEALTIQRKDGNLIGVILVKLGYLDEDTLVEYLKNQGTIVKIKKGAIKQIVENEGIDIKKLCDRF